MAWEKVSDQRRSQERKPISYFWKPEEVGETLEGILTNIVPNRGRYKNRNMYLIEKDGEIIGIMGTTILDRILPELVGKRIKIEYSGVGISKNQVEYKLFDVYVDKDFEAKDIEKDVETIDYLY
jgi:hypothetical protein